MWTKMSAPKSILASGNSSAANSQPNGNQPSVLPEIPNISAADGVNRKKPIGDDDAYHMETLVNLEKDCQLALNKMLQDPMSQNAVVIEQQLWNNFVKQYKTHMNSQMINYLIGFYSNLTDTLFFNTPRSDNYLKFNRANFDMKQTNQELMYHIQLRLGDIYRYADSRVNAKHYYEQALEIDPRRGPAYNQLALCTPLTKPYKLLYFSVMATKASIDPIKTAETNFKKALSRLDNPLFAKLRTDLNIEANSMTISVPEVNSGAEWFYLSVVAVHLNNFNHILIPLLDWILTLTQQNDMQMENIDLDYSLMALDVALDWIMIDRNNMLSKDTLEKTLRLIGTQFKTTINTDDEETNSKLVLSQKIAIKHNFILRDFAPLKSLYEKMIFYDELRSYIATRDRKILTIRLIHKLKNF